ncbi:hypothetical protein SAMN05446037_102760 [Anaerovirgula multivorans]|uniref:Uncharacterized protein n=1 Tax=Anaerovirgula multivorans TaxID=312168 RepID=A0A239IIL3_9FIRM|nr:hypothetical protein [Anaerovirgula multivorans]SNS92244.1 hypothetical protein SAMN05446037_102760 [Anaerovirgula multivorans]
MESIFIFIIFAIVSTLFKKDKNVRKTYRKPGDFEDKQVKAGEDQTFEKPKTLRELPRGGLGDLIKELKTDFDDVFKEKPSGQKQKEESYHVDYEYEGYEDSNAHQQQVDSKQQERRYTLGKAETNKKVATSKKDSKMKTVYDDEICDEVSNFTLSFDEGTLLQGIIMSEILGKPKALRKVDDPNL